jgi:hypothetical protein
MSDPDLHDLYALPRHTAPQRLVESVGSRGERILQQANYGRAKRSARTLAVDFSLVGVCVVQLIWCAQTVGLLP